MILLFLSVLVVLGISVSGKFDELQEANTFSAIGSAFNE
jgi:hypothetical protein